MKHLSDDTIAAIATPLGVGGVGVIRISGEKALQIINKIFKPSKEIKRLETHKMYFGTIIRPKSKRIIDRVLAVYMAAPASFTGEEIVEISCHGGYLVMREILSLITGNGARLAERGEFSKRAFLNGKIDLVQAEAVIDLITAKTSRAMDIAIAQVEGCLSKKIKAIRKRLLNILSSYEGSIDFPDDIEKPNQSESLEETKNCFNNINELIERANMGKIIKEGFRAAIIGRTNVGKSSLLNAILGEGRALVTSEPGTTRDTIEEAVDISGIPFTIIDTAGIRRAKSRSEKLGIKKTEAEIERADLLLLVIDGSQGLHRDENLLIKKVDRRKTIVVVNKNDFKQKKGLMMRLRGFKLISTSAIHSVGINELMNEMKKRLTTNKYYEKQECFFINNRHIMCLQKARESLQKSIESIKNNCDEEVIVIDIKGAVENLGEISGENVTEEIVEAIFSQFCVGK